MRHVVRFAATLVLALTSAGAFAAGPTIDVTTVADDGPGSYRDAIRKINELWNRGCTYADPCTLRFAIPGPVPPTGWFTIAPKSPLPSFQDTWHFTIDGAHQTALTGDTNPLGPEVELDGTDAGFSSGIRMSRVGQVKVTGLAVNRFAAHGISLLDSGGITLGADAYGRESTDALFVGVDPTGRIARPNGMDGVAAVRTSNLQLHRNVIAGNRSNGVFVRRGRGFEARSNFIGTGRDRRPIPNGANGLHFDTEDAQVLWNVIAHNRHFGVVTEDPGGRITIRENEIYDSGLLNIGVGYDWIDESDPLDMDLGPNGRMNAPVLTSAASTGSTESWRFSFSGFIRSKADAEITIEIFAAPTLNPLGQANAQTVIARGTVKTDANGKADFSIPFPWQSDVSTYFEVNPSSRFSTIATGWAAATATTWEGTSELSAPVPIQPQGSIEVTTLHDSGPASLRDAIEMANAGDCSASIPCWITFRIPAADLTDGVAFFTPQSSLPAITTDHVHLDGGSQTWSVGDTNLAGPEVEIRGSGIGAGLTIGTAERKLAHADVNDLAVTGFGGIGIDVQTSEETAMGRGHEVRLDGLYVGIEATGGVRGNGGDGIRIRGARAPSLYSESMLANSSIGGNGGNGLRIAADGTWVRRLRVGVTPGGGAAPNAGAGILVDGADGVGIEQSTV
ncbi:MAG: right-handed parallel beta-helix repeat-containing protein, partial [Thermoanaerobaculia bacterium]